MKLFNNKFLLLLGAAAITFASCADLSVENLNEPDTDRALASEGDVRALANGLFRQWYVTIHSYNGVQMGLAVGADAASCSWGNQAMQLFGTEPRPAWDNAPNFSYAVVTRAPFENLYSINSSASDVLKQLANNAVSFSGGADDAMITAQTKLVQGITTGYIALLFDQGYIVDEATPIEELQSPTLVDYNALMDHAITKLEEVVALSEANTFTLDDGVIRAGVGGGATVDNVMLEQIAHSFIARFMVSVPRTAAERANVDWAAVQGHAEDAVTSDFIINNDQWASGFWYNEGYQYLVYPGWGRLDMRVANMMYPAAYPAHNTNGEDFPAPDSATVVDTPEIDDRIRTDFQHLSSQAFRPERGLYFFSSFRHSRYDDTLVATESGDIPEISYSEIQMILAEALLEQSLPGDAAAVLNNSARVTRGGLPAVAANATEVWEAIQHETMVEHFLTGVGNEFFFMRRYDLLQEGTALHFPIPAAILETLGETKPFYTFGGVGGPGASTGGWR